MLRFAAMALLLGATPLWAAEQHNCHCIFDGGMIEEGKTACLKTPTGYTLARCDRVLNNTSWKFLDQPCDKLQSQRTSILPESG